MQCEFWYRMAQRCRKLQTWNQRVLMEVSLLFCVQGRCDEDLGVTGGLRGQTPQSLQRSGQTVGNRFHLQ